MWSPLSWSPSSHPTPHVHSPYSNQRVPVSSRVRDVPLSAHNSVAPTSFRNKVTPAGRAPSVCPLLPSSMPTLAPPWLTPHWPPHSDLPGTAPPQSLCTGCSLPGVPVSGCPPWLFPHLLQVSLTALSCTAPLPPTKNSSHALTQRDLLIADLSCCLSISCIRMSAADFRHTVGT